MIIHMIAEWCKLYIFDLATIGAFGVLIAASLLFLVLITTLIAELINLIKLAVNGK